MKFLTLKMRSYEFNTHLHCYPTLTLQSKELAPAKFIPLATQAALTKSGGCNALQLAEVEMAPQQVVLCPDCVIHNGALPPAQLALARPSTSSGWWVDWGSGALQSEG